MHTLLRLLAITSSVISIPLAAQLSKGVTQLYRGFIYEAIGDGRRPKLTELWVDQFANSSQITIVAIVLVIVFTLSLLKCWRLPRDSEKRTTGLILIPALAFITSLMLIMITLIALTLPVIEPVIMIGN